MSDYEKKRSDKMDRQGARTPADIERKYSIGKTFAEVNGIATDAREYAEAAKAASDKAVEAAKNLDHEGIFNLLTNNGEMQGIYEKDGQIYINAAYIQSLEKMFAKDLTMTGTFTNTMEAYLEPGSEEIEIIRNHILGNVTIPGDIIYRFDFNGDGLVNAIDLQMARSAQLGEKSIADYPLFPAVKSVVTMTIDLSNPNKAIRFTGKNMWARDVDAYVGVNYTSVTNPETEKRLQKAEEMLEDFSAPVDYIVERGETDIRNDNGGWTGKWFWEKWNSGVAKMYAHENRSVAVTQKWGNVYRSGGLLFDLPFMVSVEFIFANCFGVEEAVWAGQARATSDIAVECDVFCGNSNPSVNTNIHLEVIGKWK